MKRSIAFFLVVGTLLHTLEGKTYEVNTHEKISEVAAKNSILSSDTSVLKSLGLPPSIEDNSNPFPNSEGKPKNILNLIKDGARFEDNNIRPLFHFFDPLNDEGLLFFTSPTWALEDKGKIHLLQNHSFADARNHLYKALTLSDDNERQKYFGKTFESLGRVIHHIQDMAQPQHVRLDIHLNLNWTDEELPLERRSRYEIYTEDKATGRIPGGLPYDGYPSVTFTTARKFWHTASKNPKDGQGLAEFTNRNFLSAGTNFDTDRYPSPVPLLGPSNPIPFHTLLLEEGIDCNPTPPPPPPPPGNGDGSCGRDCTPPVLAVSVTATTTAPALPPACSLQGSMTFVATNVQDNYAGTRVQNDRASTLSVFDQDLEKNNLPLTYTLNRFNFRAAYPHLIPKAVAYSAGLIDYFFRGRLEAEDVTFTDTGITLRVKNAIDVKKYPQWDKEVLYDSGGTLVISYRYKLNGQERVGVSNTVPFSDRLAPGQTSQRTYSFIVSIPSNAADVTYRLVFRGTLGAENNAVAVGPIKPMVGFTFYPSYVTADGIGGSRVIYKIGGSWRLSAETGQAGNIDWKGWYINGKPTKVLSWRGPQARSFANPWWSRRPDPFETNIYQNGELWAIAPSPVLGAALTKDSTGREWIIAICKEGLSDVVYRRPNTKDESIAAYDPVTAPEGWERLASFPPDSSLTLEADVPWFFNGNGTEAQTMRKGSDYYAGFWIYRLRINITADVTGAERTNEGNLGITGTNEINKSCGANGSVTYNYTSNTSGQFYVAVDYQDNTPVFATYSQSSKYNFVFYRQILTVGSGTQGQNSEHVFSATVSIPGVPDVTISSGSVMRDARDLSFAAVDGDVTRSSFHYLDLRHGLYALYTEKTQETDSGAPIQGGDVIVPVTFTKETKQITQFVSQRFDVHENTPEATASSRSAINLNPEPHSTVPCGTQSREEFRYAPASILSVPDYAGYWAVDSGNNFFASQAALSNDPRFPLYGKTFNYLSNGDLSVVVPPGASGALYYDIGVLR